MWLIYSLISSVALTIRNLASKKAVDAQNPYVVALATDLFSFPVALIAVLIFGFEIKAGDFWLLLPIRITMDVIAFIALLSALKFKSVSFVIPLLSVTPILTIGFAYVLRGDVISANGLLGILIVAISCIVIYMAEYKATTIEDRAELFRATGLIGITALLFSILDAVHPILIEKSNTYTYFFISSILFSLVFLIIAKIKSPKELSTFFRDRQNLKLNATTGIMLGIEVIFLFLALAVAPAVALVSSVRTSNIALTAVGSLVLLKEKISFVKWIGIAGTIVGILILGLS